MSAKGALGLSLVEWRALAGVHECARLVDGGVWADEDCVRVLIGEREDRFCRQLEGLVSKGRVVRHPDERRVRAISMAATAGTGVVANATAAMSFGMDLEKALAANVRGARVEDGARRPDVCEVVVGRVADVAGPKVAGVVNGADVPATSTSVEANGWKADWDWMRRYAAGEVSEPPPMPPAAAAGTFKRKDVFVQKDVTTFKREAPSGAANGGAAATGGSAEEAPGMVVLSECCSVEVLASAVKGWVEEEEWKHFWDPELGKADYGNVNVVRGWNWLARHPRVRPRTTRGRLLWAYVQHPEWCR